MDEAGFRMGCCHDDLSGLTLNKPTTERRCLDGGYAVKMVLQKEAQAARVDAVHGLGGATFKGFGRVGADHAILHAEFDGDVVRLAAQAFFATGEDFKNEVG